MGMSRKKSPLFADQLISSMILLSLMLVAPPSTPKDAIIYIAGNAPQLGDWNPGKVAMSKENDSTRSFSGKAPVGAVVEYKITRGSWNTQAMYVDGVIPPNLVFKVAADTLVVVRPVTWNDFSSAVLENKRGGGIVGTVPYHRSLRGEGLKHERDVIVWLPPLYGKDVTRRYPVLYMHDGENVFDPNNIEKIIIVGIYNTPDRLDLSDDDRRAAHRRHGFFYSASTVMWGSLNHR
ncbi:MAG: hypothetical protein FJ217_05985 [Ignavibacteria bacterium]|nr:hypothetical protein [Ignavibacteria bacterium]